MGKKQEIIDAINQWIQTEIIPNKLQIMVEADRVDAIDFESLRLTDVYINTHIVNDYGLRSDVEVTVLVHQFDVGDGETVEVELDGFEFEEVYETDTYDMHIEEDAGLLFEKYDSDLWDIGLVNALNNRDYASWFKENIAYTLLVDYLKEIALEDMISLEKANQCFGSVAKVSYVSPKETALQFSSGVSLVLSNDVIKNAIIDYELIVAKTKLSSKKEKAACH